MKQRGYSSADINGTIVLIITDAISNGLLVIGAAMKRRICLLPWMIINVVVNILLWVAASLLIIASIIIIAVVMCVKHKGHDISGVMMLWPSMVGMGLVLLILAFVHWLILKVVIDHYRELRDKELPTQYHTIVYPNGFVNVPSHAFVPAASAPFAPATAYEADVVFSKNEKPI